MTVYWWGWQVRRWRIRYVHRSKAAPFRELVVGPFSFVWWLE